MKDSFRHVFSLALLCFAELCIANLSMAQSPAAQVLNLEQALQIALEHNHTIQEAKQQIERAHGVVIELRSSLLPNLQASAEVGQIDEDRIPELNGEKFGSAKNWNAGLQLNQKLFAGGKYWSALKEGQFREQAARLDMQTVLQDVLFAVHEKFYAVLLARQQVEVQAELLGLRQELLSSETKKRDAGTVSDFNVLRAEVELANSRTPLIRAQNSVRIALEELRRVIGIQESEQAVSQPLDVSGQLNWVEFQRSLDQSLSSAFQKRSELQRLKLLIEAQKRGVRVARADYLPEISLFAGYAAEKVPYTDNFSEELHGWNVGAKATWNIFDSFGREGRITQAVSDLNSANIALQRSMLDISVEVRRSYSSLTETNELVLASRKVAEQARESLRLAQARFDVGSGTQLDVLDSQVALQQARTNEVQSLHDYSIAVEQLKRSIGEIADAAQISATE